MQFDAIDPGAVVEQEPEAAVIEASQPKVRKLEPKVSDASVDSDGIPRIAMPSSATSSTPRTASGSSSSCPARNPFRRLGALGQESQEAKSQFQAALSGKATSSGKALPGKAKCKPTQLVEGGMAWSKEWYKRDWAWGIRRKHGDRKQIFSLGGKSCGKTREELEDIASSCIDMLQSGVGDDEVKEWAMAELAK